MNFAELNSRIAPLDDAAVARSCAHWDGLAKPIGSLGLLEKAVVKIAGLTGDYNVRLDRRAVLVLCADNGVLSEGVAQSGPEITGLVAGAVALGGASVCQMAKVANAAVVTVDMGIFEPVNVPGLLDRRIAPGTGNIAVGPAMTRDQALQAIQTGIELVRLQKEAGCSIVATGEVGIGNTTTSSAVLSVLLGQKVTDVTGRGAGLTDEGLARKIAVIERAIAVNKPDPEDALDVLAKLGGFDIAGMAGIFIGGAIYRLPVIIDGLISAVSALVAARLCPACQCAMLASHVSAEPAAHLALAALNLKPLISAGMRLGEGTGAVCAMPLLDMALSVYQSMATFTDVGIESYVPYEDFKCALS